MKKMSNNKYDFKRKIFFPLFIIFVIITYSFLITFANDFEKDGLSIKDEVLDRNTINKKINNYLKLSNFAGTDDKRELNQYPVGSIYITTDATNPNEIYDGTWTAISGGKTLVGYDAGNTNFNALKKTGGNKTVTLTNNLPRHKHDFQATSVQTGGYDETHKHCIYTYDTGTKTRGYDESYDYGRYNHVPDNKEETYSSSQTSSVNGFHNHQVTDWKGSVSAKGQTSPTPINIINPYIVVYMWQRTA